MGRTRDGKREGTRRFFVERPCCVHGVSFRSLGEGNGPHDVWSGGVDGFSGWAEWMGEVDGCSLWIEVGGWSQLEGGRVGRPCVTRGDPMICGTY